jgi:ribonuclease HII
MGRSDTLLFPDGELPEDCPDSMLQFERAAWNSGFTRVAGVDEAGRGPLAGPVVAGAILVDVDFLKQEYNGLLSDLDDSKKLTEPKREAIYERLDLCDHVSIGVGIIESGVIDQMNILRATHAAMARAVAAIRLPVDHVLVDGLPVPGLPCPSTAIVRGDSRSISIAGASIVAKVVRDRIMRKLDKKYPQYGFAAHKGYGTRAHMSELFRYGPCPVHRRSFQPVKDAGASQQRDLDLGL